MANASNTLRFLAQAFDIAPAGTREEGMAAQSLANVFHEHGLESAIATFRFPMLGRTFVAACILLIGLFGIIAGFARGVLPIVMLVLIALVGAVYILEMRGVKTVSRFGPHGSSQNVIARHPAVVPAGGKAVRPVVVIAHYDTPHADVLSSRPVARFKPYFRKAVDICLVAVPVCVLIEAIPFPTLVHSIAWAVAIVAGLVLIAWATCSIVSIHALPSTEGANDNKSAVAAVLGLLDRVRPVRGGVSYDQLLAESAVQAPSDAVRAPEPGGAAVAAQGDAPRSRRRGAEVVRSLGIIPEGCELVYELEKPKAAPAEGGVHLASAGNAVSGSQVLGGATMFIPREEIAAAAQIPAVLMTGVGKPVGEAMPEQLDEPLDPEARKDQAADAIMANIVAANGLSGSIPVADALPDPAALSAEETVAAPAPSVFDQDDSMFVEPLPDGATMLMQPVGGTGLQLPDWAPRKAESFHVITALDEPDAELRHAPGVLPPDVTGQSAIQATSSFAVVEPSEQAATVVSSDDWGTSSFQPVSAVARRILGEDLPDPAVAAIDPYSVTSIETAGDFNPGDFSQLDFETGTHEAVTPAMLEDVQRRNLDGFTADFTEKGSKRSHRKGRRGRTGRISQQAAQMQAEMEEQSFTDWMGLDEDFDAKKNGREIGSWDNFESSDGSAGGGYNRWQGGATRRRRRVAADGEFDADERLEARQAAMMLGDRELVAHEIWFVLTGASGAGHAGVEDFLDKYQNELRGAYIVNLECVGAGSQSLILEEGEFRRSKADRRLVNLFGEASAAINRPLALDRMDWRDTEASVALRQNCRAVTVCGIDRGVPANSQWSGDVLEELVPSQIDDLVDILVEVVKNA